MPRNVATLFGAGHLGVAALVAAGVFGGLPARWLPVDLPAAFLVVLLAGSGVGLLVRASWAARAARVTSAHVLVVGLALVATLAITASYLAGLYGPVGRGGALVLVLVLALALPYLVVLPAAELAWFARAARVAEKSA